MGPRLIDKITNEREVKVSLGLDPCGIDRDPRAHLGAIFELAEKHGKPVDIHLHEQGARGWFSMEEVLARTRAHGMQGRVTVRHAFCLGAPAPLRS